MLNARKTGRDIDASALEILLQPPSAKRDADLRALREAAEVADGTRCPVCGSREIEHGFGPARRCDACGEQFEVVR
jgi:hypothetical protein